MRRGGEGFARWGKGLARRRFVALAGPDRMRAAWRRLRAQQGRAMNFKSVMIAAVALAAPAAGASAQGYYGYDAPPPPPPPYAAYADVDGPAQACDDHGFTIVGAHAGVTVLGFGLNGGARFTAPSDCGHHHHHRGEGAPQFAPRPYAPPMAYAPPPYAQPGYGEEGYPAPCGCGPQGW
jgi:hypothetical protein